MNTSKPNPHTITPTTVMESEFDEPTPHRKPGKSTGRPRSPAQAHVYPRLGLLYFRFSSYRQNVHPLLTRQLLHHLRPSWWRVSFPIYR